MAAAVLSAIERDISNSISHSLSLKDSSANASFDRSTDYASSATLSPGSEKDAVLSAIEQSMSQSIQNSLGVQHKTKQESKQDSKHKSKQEYDQMTDLSEEERPGWTGYIEWDLYPEKQARAHDILASRNFPPPPEYQMEPLPKRNPVLYGERWKMWHEAIGLGHLPEISWQTVLAEKAADMIHLLQFPYNGEPPKGRLMEHEITPSQYHFVRNHGGIPDIDAQRWFVDVGGLVKQPQRLTLAMLQDDKLFKRHTRRVTLQCSGTRRIEQIELYPGEGDEMINAPWAEGAIGNAIYEGVTLKQVLEYCGGVVDGAKHVEFFGADSYVKNKKLYNYSVGVPLRKAYKFDEVYIVWSMNGHPLPKCHGYPVRMIVPGYIGARSCKWLTRINVLEHETMSVVNRKEYLYFNSQVGKHNMKPSAGFSIQDMPVSSALMKPHHRDVLVHEGSIHCEGWAYSGGGRYVIRVEVSPDGGFTWFECPQKNMTKTGYFTWRLWHMEVPLHAQGWIELAVRCWDNANNTQPTYVRSAWNWDLHVTSSAHRVAVYSVNRNAPGVAERLKALADHGLSIEPITRPIQEFDPEPDYLEARARQDPREPDEDY